MILSKSLCSLVPKAFGIASFASRQKKINNIFSFVLFSLIRAMRSIEPGCAQLRQNPDSYREDAAMAYAFLI
jgi:hypothetical protein